MPDEKAGSAVEDTTDSDAMRDIIAEDARNFLAELKTDLTEEEEEKAKEEESKEAPKSNGKRATKAASGKRNLGIDEILDQLDSSQDQTAKEAARVLRSMQTKLGDTQRQWHEYQSEFKTLAQEVERLKGVRSENEEEDPNDPLAQVPEEQVELFKQLADKLGYVKADDLSAKETEQATLEFKNSAAKQGVEAWGEEFGQFGEDGIFHFDEEVLPEIEGVFRRFLDEKRGVGPDDLFKIARFDALMEKEFERGKEEAKKELQNRVGMVRRGITETRSVAGTPKESIYKKGDNTDSVVARAMRLAMREFPGA